MLSLDNFIHDNTKKARIPRKSRNNSCGALKEGSAALQFSMLTRRNVGTVPALCGSFGWIQQFLRHVRSFDRSFKAQTSISVNYFHRFFGGIHLFQSFGYNCRSDASRNDECASKPSHNSFQLFCCVKHYNLNLPARLAINKLTRTHIRTGFELLAKLIQP